MATKCAERRGAFGRVALATILCALLPACFTFQHTVGRGPMNPKPTLVKETQWYALFGLVPIGRVDSGSMAGGAKDYRVTTKFTFVDVVITTFTSFVSFYRQTILVEK
jgi:hypothetical protein